MKSFKMNSQIESQNKEYTYNLLSSIVKCVVQWRISLPMNEHFNAWLVVTSHEIVVDMLQATVSGC